VSLIDWIEGHFDLGGFFGAVLGAIAAGYGVIYSLKKTAQFDRSKEDARVMTLRRAIVIEATQSVYNVEFLDGVLKLTSTHGSDSAFARWVGARGQLHVLNPHIMTSSLESIGLFEEKEIGVIIRLHNSICEFAEALRNTQQASENQFKQAFGDLYTKRSQLVERLVVFFDKFTASGDEVDMKVRAALAEIKKPSPAFWQLVIVGEEFAPI
jgi:hypothetical protein